MTMDRAGKSPLALPWPPVIYLALCAIAVIGNFFEPLPWLPDPFASMFFLVGLLVILCAVATEIMAVLTLRRHATTLRPDRAATHLVTDGPFAITRNPIYLGNTLAMIGIGLATGILWFLILAPVAAYITRKIAIDAEERHLTARFGKNYEVYKLRVKRWL